MTDFTQYPNSEGYFGEYGGAFVPETLVTPLEELKASYCKFKSDISFQKELDNLLIDFAGRPTPLYFAECLTEKLGGAKIYFKREDLLHTGAHKINNALGQVLLAKRMGKTRIIAETGAGQHGVATATVAARFGLKCVIYMGKTDMERQYLNVGRMQLLGAEVIPVTAGQATLKEAINEAIRDWVTNVRDSYYVLGSALGPHPYPLIVRNFQSIIGQEARQQIIKKEGRLPHHLIACIGGGSNSLGLFYHFLNDKDVKMTGVEGGGIGISEEKHAARFQGGKISIFQGTKTFALSNKDGQISLTHSISAGLDYPAIGPEHALLKDLGRVHYTYATDEQAKQGFHLLSSCEGIIPALESAHAIAEVINLAPQMNKNEIIIVNLSGRGDKDIGQIIS